MLTIQSAPSLAGRRPTCKCLAEVRQSEGFTWLRAPACAVGQLDGWLLRPGITHGIPRSAPTLSPPLLGREGASVLPVLHAAARSSCWEQQQASACSLAPKGQPGCTLPLTLFSPSSPPSLLSSYICPSSLSGGSHLVPS